jgi:hypothetical protein
MSETPAYFLLAQLFTIMTASLRLALGFLLLICISLGLNLGLNHRPLWQSQLKSLAQYWVSFLAICALVGGLCSGVEMWFLNYPNPFVDRGLLFSGGLLLLAVLNLFSLKMGKKGMTIALSLSLIGLIAACFLPGFSRSNQTAITLLFALPVALIVSYFCLWLVPQKSPPAFIRTIFHGLWALSSLVAGGLYLFWLYPRLAGLPPEGEFYPFLKLYDWFLILFMLLYLGNLYIDYWLREAKPAMLLAWNYGILIAGLLCLWFNASIFDTLAL